MLKGALNKLDLITRIVYWCRGRGLSPTQESSFPTLARFWNNLVSLIPFYPEMPQLQSLSPASITASPHTTFPCAEDKVTTLFTAPEALQVHHPTTQPPFTAGEGVIWLRKSLPGTWEQQKTSASHSQEGTAAPGSQRCSRPWASLLLLSKKEVG